MTDRAPARGVVGALALVAGACLAVVGSFLRLYLIAYNFSPVPGRPPNDSFQLEFTSWQRVPSPLDDGFSVDSGTPMYGVPVLGAAILLVVCAVVLLREPKTSPRLVAVARFTAVGAAMLLIGSIWSVGQLIWTMVSTDHSQQVTTFVGAGLWMMVVGAAVALAGALLVQQLPSRPPAPTGPVVYQLEDDDTDTPPLGFPVLVVEQQDRPVS